MSRLPFGEKSLVVAMDHARTFGVVPGLENPGAILDSIVAAGADGIMTSYVGKRV